MKITHENSCFPKKSNFQERVITVSISNAFDLDFCFLTQARALILLAECTVHGRTRAELGAMLLS
jgi:hypothetical protein